MYIDDNDTFYTIDDLKKIANDGMPKQGEMIEVRDKWSRWREKEFVCFSKWKVLVYDDEEYFEWDEWRPLLNKTELTLAEVEERLGLDAWSLTIK